MSFLKLATVTAAIILSCCAVSKQDKLDLWTECDHKCPDQPEEVKKGEWFCIEFNLEGYERELHTNVNKCWLECTGKKPAEDQNGCFAKSCRESELRASYFCTAPGAGPMKTPEECDTLVGTGKAKLYGTDLCKKKE